MHPYPHLYDATATAQPQGSVALTTPTEVAGAHPIAPLPSAPPPQFDGPGDLWSPETLLCGAIADCLVLTFRSVARASRLEWTDIACDVKGTLDKEEGVARFVAFATHVRLQVPASTDPERARAAVEKAKHHCLVANSLRAKGTLEVDVVFA